MNTISFMSANYVARQLGYQMTEGWMQGQNATIAYFQPPETFAARFEEILRDVQAMGFEAIDIWLGHLGLWATQAQIEAARRLLDQYKLRVVSLAGGFGSTVEEVEKACQMAVALNAPVMGGGTSLLDTDRPALVDLLKRYGVKFGLENHPEKTPEELLARIGDGAGGMIGLAVDTGWFGTYGYDAAAALQKLGPHVLHVHLKDVRAAGGHDTCRFGAGVVPIEGCVRALQQIGYQGAIAVEHEPHDFDPSEDVQASFAMLRGWLA